MSQLTAARAFFCRTFWGIVCLSFCLAAVPVNTLADDTRGMTPAPTRYLIVKAMGQGSTAGEAEPDALRSAYAIATKHLASEGEAAMLDTSPRGMRIVTARHFPDMGFASSRVQAVVEIALRPMPEPPAGKHTMPILRLSIDAARVLSVDANVPCEVLVAVEAQPGAEPELLPGGGGAAYRLAPGKPARLPVPPNAVRVRALACTGGLNVPAAASTVAESFDKARAGRMRQNVSQGVLSECVEARIFPAGRIPAKPHL